VITPKVIGQGGKPTRSPVPPGEPLEIPAGLICSFTVVASEALRSKLVVKTFPPKANGDIVQATNGRAFQRFTNVSTGKSITVNITGPGRFTIHADGSATLDAHGRWSFFFVDVTNAGTKAFINSGRIVIDFAPDGFATVVSQTGHEEDLCALLA